MHLPVSPCTNETGVTSARTDRPSPSGAVRPFRERARRADPTLRTLVRMTVAHPAPAVRRARVAVGALFLTNGALLANLLPRYPEVKEQLGM